MKPIKVPDTYNYIGIFLTFGCNLNCSYCINHFEKNLLHRKVIPGMDYFKGLISTDVWPYCWKRLVLTFTSQGLQKPK